MKISMILSLLSCAAALSAAQFAVPEGTSSVTAGFTAGKNPVRIRYFWKDGTQKEITVQPGSVVYRVNSNSGEKYNMPQAGYEFKGLNIVDFVRPNIALLQRQRRIEAQKNWSRQPALAARNYQFKLVNTADGAEFYINGNYAGLVPFKSKTFSALAKVDTSLDQKAFQFCSKKNDEKYHPLNIAAISNPGKFKNAKVSFKDDGKIPFAPVTSANLDLGATAVQKSLYPNNYGDSSQTGRNAFDHAEGSCLFTVPLKQYSHVWLLAACDVNPLKYPTLTARITRYVPSGHMGGRAYSAMGDTRVKLPDSSAVRVGTVQAGKDTVPLWKIRVPLNMGQVIDLVTDYRSGGKWGRGAFPMLYLDFELMGETPVFRAPFSDPRVWPDPEKISGVHVFGAVLERAGMDLHFKETTVSRNMFDDTMKPEMKVAYKRVLPGNYELLWQISDHTGKILRNGKTSLEGDSGEKTIDLAMKKLGWYQVRYTLKNGNDVILKHNASYTLMGKDTRKALWDSPYIGWTHGSAHYGDDNPDLVGSRSRMVGVRRLTSLRNKSEEEFQKYKLTSLIASSTFVQDSLPRLKKMSEDEIVQEIRKHLKRYPHARHVPLMWENSAGLSQGPYTQAPELFGEAVPKYTERQAKNAKERQEVARYCYKIIRKHFPQLKILYGNTVTCSELIGEALRSKPPKDFADYWGSEATVRSAHPEKPHIAFTMMYAWQFNRTAELLGYGHIRTTCGPENISRKEILLGANRTAEWLVRDMLVQHVFGFDDIAGVINGFGVGNSYDSSHYAGTNTRAPYFYPGPSSSATGTLTKVLDCVKFKRMVPTGSDTVYCAEFIRKYDNKVIYAVWTSRGNAELTVKTGSGNVEHVEFHGQSSKPSIWFNKLSLTAGTAAQYVITDKPFVSVQTGKRTFDVDPEADPKDFKLVDKLDSTEKWSPVNTPNVDIEGKKRKVQVAYHSGGMGTLQKEDTYVSGTRRVLAKKSSVKVVDDPEKGKCLELSIQSDRKLNDQYFEYMAIRPQKPILIADDVRSIGMWVKGNSGWGEVWWELEDANGIRRVSSSTLVHGGSNYEYTGRASIDYDSWNFLSMPVTSRSGIIDVSTGNVCNLWSGPWGEPAMPCKLTGIYFCAPVKPIFLNSSKYVDQTIRIKDVSAETQPIPKIRDYGKKILVMGDGPDFKSFAGRGRSREWFANRAVGEKRNQPNWFEDGYVFPHFEDLFNEKYAAVCILGRAVSKSSMAKMKTYVENGGILLLSYTAAGACYDRNRAFIKDLTGIAEFKSLREIPYTQKVALEHELATLPAMGKEKIWKRKDVYTMTAAKLNGAEPLIVHRKDKEKGLAAATIYKKGSGYVVFYGCDGLDYVPELLQLAFDRKDAKK